MHPESIELLNRAVADEMSASHQYMFFHFHCEDQGLELLSRMFHRIAIEEMVHIERCAERILFLGGEVEMKPSEEVKKIHDVTAMLEMARQMEAKSIQDYNQWANDCAAKADSGSRKVFEGLVDEEEGHYGQFDLEQSKVEKFGDRYLALQSIEGSKGEAAGGAV